MCGAFGAVMLQSGIDPTHVLGHVPKYFLYMQRQVRKYTINPGITRIGDRSFEQVFLSEVNIPQGVTIIGLAAFRATYISKLKLPESTIKVDDLAFSSCHNLKEVDLGKVKNIGDSILNYCPELTKVIVPDTLMYLPSGTFYRCDKLKDITYLGTVEQFENMVKDELEDWTNRYRVVCKDGVIQ